MSRFPNFNATEPSAWQGTGTSNPAVVRFFNAVYAWMCTGLALTAVVAYFFSQYIQTNYLTPHRPFNSLALIAVFVVELLLVGVIAGAINRISAAAATSPAVTPRFSLATVYEPPPVGYATIVCRYEK